MWNFNQEESARIEREMSKRRAMIHMKLRRLQRIRVRRLERTKLRRLEIMRRKLDVLAPVVDEAMPFNRCFPPESHYASFFPNFCPRGQGELSWIWNNE